jgi:hypothetical protein
MLFSPQTPLFDELPEAGNGGGADFDSMFSSVMAGSSEPAKAEAAPAAPNADPVAAAPAPAAAPSAPAATPAAAPAAVPTPAPEAPKPAEVEPEADKAAEPAIEDPEAEDAELEAAQATDAPNILDLKTSRGKRIYGAYKAYKGFVEALGHEPTTEQIQEHYQAYTDSLSMEQEFLSGDPAAQANFAAYWHDRSPQAFQSFVAQLPEQLAAGDAAAYTAMAVPVLQRYINAQYQLAANETDPDRKAAVLYHARMADWSINNRYRKDNELAAVPAVDPQLAAREQQVALGMQRINEFNQQQQWAAVNQWTQGLNQTVNSELDGAVDTALAPLKAAMPQRIFDAAKRDFTEAVRAHLSKDADGGRIFETNAMRAKQRLSSEDFPALAGIFMQRASRAIRTLAPGFLKDAGVAAQAQSAQRHQALQAAAAAGNVPSAAGAPVAQIPVPASQRKFASKSEQMDAMLEEALGTGR